MVSFKRIHVKHNEEPFKHFCAGNVMYIGIDSFCIQSVIKIFSKSYILSSNCKNVRGVTLSGVADRFLWNICQFTNITCYTTVIWISLLWAPHLMDVYHIFQDPRKVRVWAEKVFRGRKYPKIVEICSASYKPDYRLIPKDEEESYCKTDSLGTLEKINILPQTIPFPPLLRVSWQSGILIVMHIIYVYCSVTW